MKIIFLTLAIYAHAYVVFSASTEKNPGKNIETMIDDKCLENSHGKYGFENIDEVQSNFMQCQTEAFSKIAPHPVLEHEKFCRYLKDNQYSTCLKNLAIGVLPCLDETEIFFPQMILEAYNTTFNQICGTQGSVKMEEILNKLQKNEECIRETKALIGMGGKCIENLTAFNNFFKKNVIDLNKHDYCIDMESFLSCATDLVEEQCNDDFSLIADIISDLFLGVCRTE